MRFTPFRISTISAVLLAASGFLLPLLEVESLAHQAGAHGECSPDPIGTVCLVCASTNPSSGDIDSPAIFAPEPALLGEKAVVENAVPVGIRPLSPIPARSPPPAS